jgi:nucleoside-diphosphate-sugar epimerase
VKQTVLVTGANGFIGRHTCEALRNDPEPCRVVGLSRSTTAVADVDTWCQVDLTDAAAVLEVVKAERPDIVIHLAGALRHASAPEHVVHNTLATTHLLQAIAGRCRRVVFGSSGIVYGGPLIPTGLSHEGDCPHPRDSYAVSKLAAEGMAAGLWPARDEGLVIARIFNVCGPGQDTQHVVGALAQQLVSHPTSLTVRGPLDVERDFVDVRDVARALVGLALRPSVARLINVASGKSVAIGEVVRILVEITAYRGAITEVPDPGSVNLKRQCGSIGRLRAARLAPRIPLRQSLEDVVRTMQ